MAELVLVEYSWDQEERARRLAGVLALHGFRVRLRRVEGTAVLRFHVDGEVYEGGEFELLARRLARRAAVARS